MMKNELCIKNWVQIPFLIDVNGEYNGYTQIKQIYDNCVDTFVINEVKFDELKPIVITTELLKKIGFTKYDGPGKLYDVEEYENKDKTITIKNFQDGHDGWYCHVDDSDMDTIGNCMVKYLHQLQNFLTICGKEFIISL